MTNEEKVEILLKYFGNELGNIDLSDIDFGNKAVIVSGVKAREIYNTSQNAKTISNFNQEANAIYNGYQQAREIYNVKQEASKIDNSEQITKVEYEKMSKEELIARIKELENEQ